MKTPLSATSPAAQQVLLDRVLQVLQGFGVPEPLQYAKSLSYQKKLCLQHFFLACGDCDIPLKWGPLQIEAFLLHLDDQYLVSSGIKRNWKVITDVGALIGRKPTRDQLTLYDYVLANCQLVQDIKLPISQQLLVCMCDNAPLLFAEYDAALFRCLFLVAWGAFMRVGEYTQAREGRKDHNIYEQSVVVTDLGCGVTFLSDKVSADDPTPKYRFIDWPFLPSFAKEAIQRYSDLRPKGAKHFFVHEDGRPLTRDDVVNAIDICVLHSPYWRMRYVSHGFRIGGASQARLAGVNILQIENQGRWGKNSRAVEHYTRQQFLHMSPDQLYEHEKYRKDWTRAKIRYLSKEVVQTPGGATHPHHRLLLERFPKFLAMKGPPFPTRYPQPHIAYRLKQRKWDRLQGTFIKPYISQRTRDLRAHNLRTSIRSLARKVSAHRASPRDRLELACLKRQRAVLAKAEEERAIPGETARTPGPPCDRATQTTSREVWSQWAQTDPVPLPELPPPQRHLLDASVRTGDPGSGYKPRDSLADTVVAAADNLPGELSSGPNDRLPDLAIPTGPISGEVSLLPRQGGTHHVRLLIQSDDDTPELPDEAVLVTPGKSCRLEGADIMVEVQSPPT